MALDLRQQFVSAQYVEIKLTEFHQIIYMHSYWQDLACDCYTSFFAQLFHSYGPFMALDFRRNFVFAQYVENKLTEFYPNLYNVFILARSSLGLLHVIFRTFVP